MSDWAIEVHTIGAIRELWKVTAETAAEAQEIMEDFCNDDNPNPAITFVTDATLDDEHHRGARDVYAVVPWKDAGHA